MKKSTLFGALYLILAGLLLLTKNIFNLHFSSFSVLFALALLVLGIYLLSGRPSISSATSNGDEQLVFFNNTRLVGNPNITKYTVVFSNAIIEMPYNPPPIVEVTSLFSSTRVVIAPGYAARVKLSAAFASAYMPGVQVNGFGEQERLLGDGPATYMEASAVFGTVFVDQHRV